MWIGCLVSCAAFERFSTFLEWAIKHSTGLQGVAHYLDGFLFVGPGGSGHCKRLLKGFRDMTEQLGTPLAHEKTVGPSQVLTFLGD